MAATPVPHTKGPKLNTTNLHFDGKQSTFRQWKDAIDLFMIGNPDQFDDDIKKVAFTLSYMDGTPSVRTWASNQQRSYGANHWPEWDTFERVLAEQFQDPATEEQARTHLMFIKQGNKNARAFFSELDLWFALAGVTEDSQKYAIVKRAMNPQLRTSLTLVGFPADYPALKGKMEMLEDEGRKAEAVQNPRGLDARFAEAGTKEAHRYVPPTATYRAQGSTPAPRQGQQMSYHDILKKPIGSRPKPRSPCYRCKDSGRDAYHWRDECPVKDIPRVDYTPRPPNAQQGGAAQNPPRQNYTQGRGRPNNRGRGRGRGGNPQRFRRNESGPSTDAMASASAQLAALPEALRRQVLIEQAKAMSL